MGIENYFQPSQEFLASVGEIREYKDIVVPSLNQLASTPLEDALKSVLDKFWSSCAEGLQSHYGRLSEAAPVVFAYQEVLKNSLAHSPGETDTFLRLYYGDRGFGMAIHDGGDFYRNHKTMETFPASSHVDKHGISGYGLAMDAIKQHTDFQEIDSSRGTFFLSASLGRMSSLDDLFEPV